MNQKIKDIIRSIAPALGTALGGPLAGLAVKTIGDKLLSNPQASEDDVAKMIESASPEQLLKLRELDRQFEKDMKALDIDIYKIEVQDRSSARDLFRVNYWPQIILSALYTVGYFVVLALILTGKVASELPVAWQAAAQTIVGILTAAVTTILAFWFGSSFGSKEKTAALSASQPANEK